MNLNEHHMDLAVMTYQEAASRIFEELGDRGFTVDDPGKTNGLADKITNIILETVRGNTNYCGTTANEDGSGWPKVKTIPDELKDKLIREECHE